MQNKNNEKYQGQVFRIKKRNFVSVDYISGGTQGKVFKVVDQEKEDQVFALKEINFKQGSEQQKYAQTEIENVKKVMQQNSEYIVKFLDYQLSENVNQGFILMEYCNQGDLQHFYNTHQQLSESTVLEITSQILNGLIDLKELDIIHRDIKMENILRQNGNFKIGDLGISKEGEAKTNNLGTTPYMAPEMIDTNLRENPDTYCALIDIYSLGVITYQLLYRKWVYDDFNIQKSNQIQVMQGINKYYDKINFKSDVIKVSEELQQILKDMLQPDPQKRINHEDLLDQISNILEEKTVKKNQGIFNLRNTFIGQKQFQNMQKMQEDYDNLQLVTYRSSVSDSKDQNEEEKEIQEKFENSFVINSQQSQIQDYQQQSQLSQKQQQQIGTTHKRITRTISKVQRDDEENKQIQNKLNFIVKKYKNWLNKINILGIFINQLDMSNFLPYFYITKDYVRGFGIKKLYNLYKTLQESLEIKNIPDLNNKEKVQLAQNLQYQSLNSDINDFLNHILGGQFIQVQAELDNLPQREEEEEIRKKDMEYLQNIDGFDNYCSERFQEELVQYIKAGIFQEMERYENDKNNILKIYQHQYYGLLCLDMETNFGDFYSEQLYDFEKFQYQLEKYKLEDYIKLCGQLL